MEKIKEWVFIEEPSAWFIVHAINPYFILTTGPCRVGSFDPAVAAKLDGFHLLAGGDNLTTDSAPDYMERAGEAFLKFKAGILK